MYELHPYFTNDGTVGLYSPQDDDIYHSTYGALSESWEKFVIPAHLREYLATHNEVKILDICYGIGYNTKTALNVFLDEVETKEKKYLKNKKTKNFFKIKLQKKIKNNQPPTPNCAAIHTDNISRNFEVNFNEKSDEIHEITTCNTIYSAQLDTDNKSDNYNPPNCHAELDSASVQLSQGEDFSDNINNKILIDAVDSDKILMGLSPFIVSEVKNKFLLRRNILKTNSNHNKIKNFSCPQQKAESCHPALRLLMARKTNSCSDAGSCNDKGGQIPHQEKDLCEYPKNLQCGMTGLDCFFSTENKLSKNKNKLYQIKKMQKYQLSQIGILKKEFRTKKEVSIILLEALLKNGTDDKNNLINDEILQKILADKKYSPYFSNYMMNLVNFYSNRGYKTTNKKNKMAFLHNIYYQYVSGSYKRAQKMLRTAQIDLNFHPQDARTFIQSTSSSYNFVFLDAFTPSKCPALWTFEFFSELHSKLEDDGMILTYSNSAAIRNAFLKSGFFVGKVYNKDTNKFTGTVAVKNNNLIEHHLNQHDLDLINSKAGICYRDENLNCTNDQITENRSVELNQSDLVTSSKVMKDYKKTQKETI